MAGSKKLVFWTSLVLLHCINSSSSQRLDTISDTCSGSDEMKDLKAELKALRQFVRNQAISIEILEEELKFIKQTVFKSESLTSTSLVMSSTPTSTEGKNSLGNRGKEFLVLFMGNYPSVSGPVTVYITTENNAMVNISSSPFLNANIKSKTDKTVYFNSMSIISLPFTLTCEYLTVEPKAVIVQTSEPSTVTIFDSFGETTNDGTLIIPTNKLSTKYLVSSTMPVLNSVDFYSQFAIGALYDDTSVQIELKIGQNSSIHVFGGTYKDGDTFSVVLSRLETLQVNHTTDLTGTFITATKPLAVFSGKQCQLWKPSRCSHVVTQLPPISELDTHYIVAPFHNNEITLIRIVSAQETYINSSFGDKKITRHLYGRNPQNLTATSNSITVIVSDQPVLITGFGMGGPYDPYMTVIPGINQYLSYYKIPVPEGYTENFICVIIPQISLYNLRINGNSFNKFKTVFQSSIVLENIFSVFTIQVERGIFILSTTDNSKFGLIVYGHRYSDGYGFAGNFLLN